MRWMLFMFIALVSGCGGSSYPRPTPVPRSPFAGIWLESGEAEELRLTGQLLSLCEESRLGTRSTNARKIDDHGNVFIYLPAFSESQALRKIGTLSLTGEFTDQGFLRGALRQARLRVRLQENKLVFTSFMDAQPPTEVAYVRSTSEEVHQYYRAQSQCGGVWPRSISK